MCEDVKERMFLECVCVLSVDASGHQQRLLVSVSQISYF